jgi:hypothetical protein
MEEDQQQQINNNKRAGDELNVQEQPPPRRIRHMPVNEKADVMQLTRQGSLQYEKKPVYRKDLELTEEHDETMALFGRHLGSFRNGDVVQKHCSPWGECLRLHDSEWFVDRKVFDDEENELLFVILRRHPECSRYENNYFMVGGDFFSGWTDAATRQLAYDAQARADAKDAQ